MATEAGTPGRHERPRRGAARRAGGARTLRSWGANLFLLAAAGFAALMLVPALLGLDRYVITGDSMSGTYDRGSLVFAEIVPVEDLRIGDVITYEPPPEAASSGLITHRIVSLRERGAGAVLRTKGDANDARDPWTFRLEGANQARAELGVPYVGFGFAALGIREVRMALIGGPAVLIAIALLAGLWRDAGRDLAAGSEDEVVEPGASR